MTICIPQRYRNEERNWLTFQGHIAKQWRTSTFWKQKRQRKKPTTAHTWQTMGNRTARLSVKLVMLYCRDGTTDVTRTMHFGTPSKYEQVQWPWSSLILVRNCSQSIKAALDLSSWKFVILKTNERDISYFLWQDCFTRVLKGHISLDTVKFPQATKGTWERLYK